VNAAGSALVFRDPQILDVATGFPGIVRGIASPGDVDGDGRADCVLATEDGYVYYFPGLPDGTVGATAVPVSLTYKNGTSGQFLLRVADLDGDGDNDIALDGSAAIDSSLLAMYFLRNDGGGAFTSVLVSSDGEVTTGQRRLFDFEGDGDLDLVVKVYQLPYMTDPGLRVYVNENGVFTAGPRVLASASGHLQVADVDGDGLEDAVLGYDAETRVILQRPGGVLEAQAPIAHPGDTATSTLVALDFDGDGDKDLLTRNRRLLLNDGGGEFTEQSGPAVGPSFQLPHVVDVDNDGLEDVVDPTGGNYIVNFHRNSGGAFEAPIALPTGFTSGNNNLVAVGDADEDGKPDIVHLNIVAKTISILRQAGFPAPTGLAVIPASIDEAGTVVLDLSGTGLMSGATVELGAGIAVTGVVVDSPTEASATLDVSPGIGGGLRTVRFVNPDLQQASAPVEVRSLDAALDRGELRDGPEPARDVLRMRGRLPRNALSSHGEFAGGDQGLRLEVGSGPTRLVVAVPAADARWREERRGRRLVFKTLPTEFPRVRIAVDTARERFELRVTHFDYPQPPANATLSVFSGTDLGRAAAEWEPLRGGTRWRIR
jgi:hypothetical protein